MLLQLRLVNVFELQPVFFQVVEIAVRRNKHTVFRIDGSGNPKVVCGIGTAVCGETLFGESADVPCVQASINAYALTTSSSKYNVGTTSRIF